MPQEEEPNWLILLRGSPTPTSHRTSVKRAVQIQTCT